MTRTPHAQQLIRWFLKCRRSFPWREEPAPYRVWVSEVMLQQTQATVVVPYFRRWMELFPTIETLAAAPLDQVLKVWEGLGYYSRARRLHAAARYLVEHHDGRLPDNKEALMRIPGLGPYTVGAILSFAFHCKAPAVDGNVMRVATRLFGIDGEIEKKAVQRKIEDKVMDFLPNDAPWVAMEALIELGATVCGRKAQCGTCPLRQGCAAYRNDAVDRYPQKKPRKKTTELHRSVGVIRSGTQLLIERSTEGKVMSHLCQFPFVELGQPVHSPENMLKDLEEKTGLKLEYLSALDRVTHTFTRYRATLYPLLCRTKDAVACAPFQWMELNKLAELPFSSGHRQIFEFLPDTQG